MRFRTLLPISFLIIAITSSFCFAGMIFTSVSQDSLYIGDRIRMGVFLIVSKGGQVVPPATDNGFGKIAVKEWTSSTVPKKNADSITFNFAITTYSTENCTIPSLDFIVTNESKAETLRTQPFPLRVVLVSSPDTTSIKDLKPQQNAGKPSLLWLWVIIGIVAASGVANYFVHFKKKRIALKEVVPLKPPFEEAIEALDRLEAKEFVAKGMIREHVFELSEIIKRYIERRFTINAVEYTTEEMLDWVKRSPLDPAMRRCVEWFFSTTDPVKFAKWLPDNDTLYRFGADMRTFVVTTRPVAAPSDKKDTVPSPPQIEKKTESGNAV
jgi:hypothetical protein